MRTRRPGAGRRALGATPARQSAAPQSYRVELPLDLLDEQGRLLDWLIGYAFDTLDARHLDLRIVAATHPISPPGAQAPPPV
jgi:hypothetical protein